MSRKYANVSLTVDEFTQLRDKGYVKISDPERGIMEIRLFFGEDHVGVEGRHGHIKVIKSGTAAKYTE